MSKLLLHPRDADAEGRIHAITPESAGWRYVGFEVFRLGAGQRLSLAVPGGREACLVLVSGRAEILAGGANLGLIGARISPFDGSPWSVYAPAGTRIDIRAESEAELALCSSPGTGALPVRVIPPEAVGLETRGKGTNTRHVRNILPESEAAESLLVVEVITPGGHWSSYPSHKHDTDDFPHETYLEETYYHRLARPGFALQRVYTDDRSLDETMAVADRDVVLVPRGYHPVGAPHGFDLYYLNVMAGPKRAWRFRYDPDQAWLL
ncbi:MULTISPECIES: 5-deoxy-glucuronate isomerase [Rhodomicrobium]|uniref:5-deoxy-glucuronate isomerase n=1 Tax=Rhodomicrobium TaxID=1068 RepID=UPI000B4C012C|nr:MULTISPECIES: 5-deoxy-glucuronate isomerase [Rhodomicrobium]